jgi:hypothetical protein
VGYEWPTWDEWLAKQDVETRDRALRLAESFRACGCDAPDDWVRSEIDEDFAQLARFIFLRLLWDDQLQPWRDPSTLERFTAAKELLESGADAETMLHLCGLVASYAVWRTLTLLDGVWITDLPSDLDLPRWRLMEVNPVSDELTGRDLGGLHESIREVDPEGRDGDPLF